MAVAGAMLAACGNGGDASGGRAAGGAARSGEPGVLAIPCATKGGTMFEPRCTAERQRTPAGTMLTLRDPDGGFHRLLVTDDGRGVVAADGAAPAHVAIAGPDGIEVALGGSRYRLPATVGRARRP